MPTYQYACTACGHRFEAVQSFSDSSLTDCPECAGRLRKVFSSVGIVFKGSGFYRTDSRSGGDTAKSGEGRSGDKPTESSAPKEGAAKEGSSAKDGGSPAGGKEPAKSSTGSSTTSTAKAGTSS